MSKPSQQSKYSVLVMGKTQAGKSTLVQHIKNYANPDYPIDRSLIGNGRFTTTQSTQPFYVESNLPVYEAFRLDSGEVIDLDDLPNKIEDEEDYRKLVMSRDKDVGMRVAHRNPNGPSEVVEFRFLDTPGLNDTGEGDTSHAANIIKEMISTRSFNLIVIIISFKNPLTQEQQLALEYYANVFKGLHTRIMFLHTHVEYTEIHHSNQTHHLNLWMKNRALSKMFRRYDSDTAFDEDNFQFYTSRTIDMVTKKRPVINCLIRNTIREILELATAPAAILDTSSQNIERIRAIIHPTKFNDDQRERIKQRFLAEAAKLPKAKEEEQVDVGGKDLEQINILLIGDVQSGKSSLVETFRLYADPTYIVNTQHITQGNSRFADEKVKVTAFLSDLHTIQIRKKKDAGGYDVINLEEEAKRMTEEDFEGLLNLGQKEAETVIITSNGAKRYRFNVYEGPSLNESAGNFEKNIFSVHKTLVESKAKFHQVLFTLAPGPITSAIKTTIRVCSDILSDLSPFFSFVHTKVDYPKLHAGNKQFHESMKERQDILQRYIKSGSATYMIDNNLESYSPVQRAKTQNVLYDILKAATNHKPVVLKSPLMKKTPKMLSIDVILMEETKKVFLDSKRDRFKCHVKLLEALQDIKQADADIKKITKERSGRSTQGQLNDEAHISLEAVYEHSFGPDSNEYSSPHTRVSVFDGQGRKIERLFLEFHNIDIEESFGGEGFDHWRIAYRRKSMATSFLDVKIYSISKGTGGECDAESMDLDTLRQLRQTYEDLLEVVKVNMRHNLQIEQDYDLLVNWTTRKALSITVMQELIDLEVYESKEAPFDTIKQIYLKSGDISVLVFGKTQAGKSTLIQFVKNYVDQRHDIDWDLIGNHVVSKTEYPVRYTIATNLPEYEVCHNTTKETIDVNSLDARYEDPEDYVDALNNRKTTLRPVQNSSDSPSLERVVISFLDTPGIEDTNSRDVEHATRIIHEMSRTRFFNLILVVVNHQDCPSRSQQLAFDYYSKVIQVFQGNHSNIVFLYTHVKYEDCHYSREDYHANMKLRHKAFSRIFRGRGHRGGQGSFTHSEITEEQVELYRMRTIDLDKNQRPITRCMRLQSLRDVLQLAILNPPVSLNTSPENMSRIYGITHPDALNNRQRNKILAPMQAILAEKHTDASVQGDGSAAEMAAESNDAVEDDYLSDYFNKTGDNRYRDRGDAFDDFEAYFHDSVDPLFGHNEGMEE